MKESITLLMILFLVTPAIARDGKLSAIFIDLAPVTVTQADAGRINASLRRAIDSLKHCALRPPGKVASISKKHDIVLPCRDTRCAARLAKLAGAERAIYGSVTRRVVKYDRPMGDRGSGKYLLEEKERELFIVTLRLVDAERETLIATITDAPERAAARLQPFFTPSKAADEGDADTGSSCLSIHAAPSFFIPVGSFRSMARAALGLNTGLTVAHPAMKGARVMAQFGYHYLFSDNKNIESFHALTLAVFGGYEFLLPKSFSVTPMAGGGYLIHLLSQDVSRVGIPGVRSYSTRVYADPHLTARFEGAWRIDGHVSLFAAPFFTTFFEKSATGIYPGFDIGVRYTF